LNASGGNGAASAALPRRRLGNGTSSSGDDGVVKVRLSTALMASWPARTASADGSSYADTDDSRDDELMKRILRKKKAGKRAKAKKKTANVL
jgi:hypothetical protein